MLIRNLAETTSGAPSLRPAARLVLERGFKQSLDFQVQRIKAQRARKQEQINTLAAHAAQTPRTSRR